MPLRYLPKVQTIICEPGTTVSPAQYYSLIRPQILWRLQMIGFLDLVPFSLLPIYQTTRCHSPEDTNLHCPHRYSFKSHTQKVARIHHLLRTRKLAFQCLFYQLKSLQLTFYGGKSGVFESVSRQKLPPNDLLIIHVRLLMMSSRYSQ